MPAQPEPGAIYHFGVIAGRSSATIYVGVTSG
jgi:hypothetical protein